MMTAPILQFIVIAIVAALFLWFISQFPTLDATVVKFIRIAVLAVLSLLLLNLVLVLLFSRTLASFLH